MSEASRAGLLGTLLTSGLAYFIRLPEHKFYPKWLASTLKPSAAEDIIIKLSLERLF